MTEQTIKYSPCVKRVVRRLGGALVLGILTFTLLAGGWRFMQITGGVLYASTADSYITVVVTKGDTLWNLAVTHGPRCFAPR